MLPADFAANALPTLDRVRNLLAAAVLVLGAAGLLYGVFKCAEWAIDLGAYGWGWWRSRRQALPPNVIDIRRRELDAVVHVPYRNGFGKGGTR